MRTQTERRIVDNRVFLLGLDELYREAMKRHEREELLRCAEEVAQTLSVRPANVPIEGYYYEDKKLTRYFRLMRGLQSVRRNRESEVLSLNSFQRLREVTEESGLLGFPESGDSLLRVVADPLTLALNNTFPEWNVNELTQAAHQLAPESEDFSLVALASLSKDAVVLVALRESVVLYVRGGGAGRMPRQPEYVWEVDLIIEDRAKRFVRTFNELFNEGLPEPKATNAKRFYDACRTWKIIGRCVRIGVDVTTRPNRHYHWAIDLNNSSQLRVNEFWDTEIWTTERYRQQNGLR